MKKLLCAVVALPFLTATAFAQPSVLDEKQMDTVTAGWSLNEYDQSNTSETLVLVYTPDNLSTTACTYGGCYLNLRSPAIDVFSVMLSVTPQ